MRDRLEEFGEVDVALILFTRQRNLRGYRSRFEFPFPLLTDERRTVYRAYGLGRGSVARVYSPRAVAKYVGLVARGHTPKRPTEDTLQLGGDFVVDSRGRLVYAFRGAGPDTRPSVDELIDAVRRARVVR